MEVSPSFKLGKLTNLKALSFLSIGIRLLVFIKTWEKKQWMRLLWSARRLLDWDLLTNQKLVKTILKNAFVDLFGFIASHVGQRYGGGTRWGRQLSQANYIIRSVRKGKYAPDFSFFALSVTKDHFQESFKNSHFKNEAECRTFLVEMNLIFLPLALNLALRQRLAAVGNGKLAFDILNYWISRKSFKLSLKFA